MMWAVLRRKAASAGSSNLVSYGKVQSLGKVRPAVAGSMSQSYSDAILTPEAPALGRNPKLARQIHQGVPVYSMPISITLTRLGKRVATRLKDSQNTFALLTTFNEVDMTNLMKLRSEYKDAFLEKHGVKLGLMSGFVKVSCRMMQSSRSLIQRVTPIFSARIRQNSRLLSSASSSLLAKDPQSSPTSSSGEESVHLSDNCVRRMKELQADEAKEKLLRISIEAGGCSGFQYNFALEEKPNDDDRIFERDGVKLVVDTISLGFVKGATVDYVEELIRSGFQVAENPSAVGGCSCKSSFMVK
ncbi:iron-sulfur assembly protein IscA-like 2, mitochondrial isoform X1 [Helianthus annuus]|uniref:iron-sulfur assembly protein IscA-like 2, mitochondrial isoform X1 n=3 Tax=Helianthus annuus TaxID=4232 RepID=UPI000B9083AA|nr:iron-sulfur assembly protein IscA-like 2, mitochondrial isoform X1 [Helianthus annuus]XP_022022693.1 iron-sulfur assembly protein IscA-like 2, mitochondrial isoform X1 [Helianthus annuus]